MTVRKVLYLLVAVLLRSSLVFRQESRGTTFGRVVDRSGAVIAGASVKITNTATGVSMPVTTNEQGNYLAPYLIPGPYRIEAEHRGFKRVVRDGIELRVNDRLEINPTLEVGEVIEQVAVVAETPMLETATASMGSVVDSRRIAELPLPHGNPSSLIQLAPGAVFVRSLTLDRPFERGHIIGYAIDEARGRSSEISIDGVSNTSTLGGSNTVNVAYVPPSDVVAEFKLQTTLFDASSGQTQGGAINLSLKSGTNAFHGTAYYVKMALEMTANTFFANRTGQPRSDFSYNRWGTMASGPVVSPRFTMAATGLFTCTATKASGRAVHGARL